MQVNMIEVMIVVGCHDHSFALFDSDIAKEYQSMLCACYTYTYVFSS